MMIDKNILSINLIINFQKIKIKLLLLILFTSFCASAQDSKCNIEKLDWEYCRSYDFSPYGSTIYEYWKNKSDNIPYKVLIRGAKASSIIIGKYQLRINSQKNWVIVDYAGVESKPLINHLLIINKDMIIMDGGHSWVVNVTKIHKPSYFPGVSVEGEINFDLLLIKI
jgi:hypothetical protein